MEFPRWPLVFVIFVALGYTDLAVAEDHYRSRVTVRAIVNITYRDALHRRIISEADEIGTFGRASRVENESGLVVHVRSHDNKTDGCQLPVNVPGGQVRWIALIQRGQCKFTQKIRNAAVLRNASAVVIYDNKPPVYMEVMDHAVDDVVSIFIGMKHGEHIAQLVDSGTKVMMYISVGDEVEREYQHMNKTSVVFVSVSFIVLIIISLGWLVFYYIQRFRYAHAKERLANRLMNAAKKAITKMPMRTLKPGDKETTRDYQCAVCLEGYKNFEVVRILPCMHFFHKTCVDPWLIEQRNCPMCKLDILKALGLKVPGVSRENVGGSDADGIVTAMLPMEALPSSSDAACSEDSVTCPHSHPAQVEHHQDPTQVLSSSSTAPEASTEDAIQIADGMETQSLMPQIST